MHESDTVANRNYLFHYLLIGFLILVIVAVYVGKTYAYNKSQSGLEIGGNGISSKLDCITEGHQAKLEALKEKPYSANASAYEIPNVTLVDQYGNDVELKNLIAGDQPVLMNFIYTTCTTICPVLSSSFTKVQDFADSDLDGVQMVSITIDPENDSPGVLNKYAKRFRASSEWLFLTGDLENILAVQNAFDAYRGDKMNHIPLTFIRHAGNEKWLRMEGFPSVEEILSEYKTLNKGNSAT
ncbi:MAG: SCO family protein [Chromatiales bacterium]|nr:SCO family protein [Chromatiales bacterium]